MFIKYPVIQAPMAGGIIPPEFVAAVSEAGCLGSLAAGAMPLSQLEEQIHSVQTLTTAPFQVNIFAHDLPEPHAIEEINHVLNEIRRQLSIPEIEQYTFSLISAEDYAALCIQLKVPVVSFTFGCPSRALVETLHQADITVIGTVSTVDEALIMQQRGVDMVVAQGYEAGGHQGGVTDHSSIGLMALVPQVVDAVNIPVIAAGGISDKRGVKAALALGASYVQIGTRFLNTFESTAHALHKSAINQANETETLRTKTYTGKTARGVQNDMMTALSHYEIPPYPCMDIMTKDIRAAAKKQQRIDYMSNWCGQNIRTSQTEHLTDVIAELTATFH